MDKPKPNETEIVDSSRIASLTKSHFKKLATRESGWTILYLDPSDGRYWELSHPQSELHGGGPPLLMQLDSTEARRLYSLE